MAELKAYNVICTDDISEDYDVNALGAVDFEAYACDDVDKFITELKENHKKEVDRLLMKISGLEKLVETADKIIKQKGGFTIKDVTFSGVKLEEIKEEK